MKTIKPLLILVFFVLAASGFSQSRSVIKKQCVSALGPYVSDGNMNNAKLAAGETAELNYTFHPGKKYRITMAAQEILGSVQFILKESGKVIFDSNRSGTCCFDFDVADAKQMTLEVSSPPSEDMIVPNGQVVVMVGVIQ